MKKEFKGGRTIPKCAMMVLINCGDVKKYTKMLDILYCQNRIVKRAPTWESKLSRYI